ncbi:hypothetical protein R2R35_18665 [Anaerocolumna sp. AGMB13020]|uniref:hypothetical protein n=1 Tax=Anaerocolumna sp. AGMB13020 TaxID=3081750 RepID=UPI002953D79A|nr:hypothetical protein [Anaerocolumna sp. AGMB13020]WOO35804.1 hypothetical protein R2R35_18665 [Anaerocolumna sp. AGMB13020]
MVLPKSFNYKSKSNKSGTRFITLLEIESLSPDIESALDNHIVSICEGASGSDLSLVKQRLINLFCDKNDEWKIGAISEFFIHLYANMYGFKQECLFFNLEERSIKKGFDGYYSFEAETWVMESKSGFKSTKGISHSSKIKEAMSDLTDKFSGRSKNNPWQNAYSHASHCDVGTSSDIKKSIKKLSDNFILGSFDCIDNFNIMPCATIFLESTWSPKKHADIFDEIVKILPGLKGKKIRVMCITQKTIKTFIEYIEKK